MKKTKYLQIFNYLKEFSKIRSNPVKDIDTQENQYPEKIWLSNIPHDELFDNIIREGFNYENEYWIKINKPIEPIKPLFPKLSKNLEIWISPNSLLNIEKEPTLREEIEINGIIYHSDDNPNLTEELSDYINQKWLDHLFEYNTRNECYEKEKAYFNKLNDIYKRFFRIHNKAQQFGEEYELVIAIGLLNYQENSNSPKIFRHILCQRVEIKFEHLSKDSQILVYPNIENDPQVESDILFDLPELFDTQNIIDSENILNQFLKDDGIDSFFNHSIFNALQAFAERISPDGRFSETIEKPSAISEIPLISYSPALLLRKRNAKSFTTLYEQIIENINNCNNEIDIPPINDIIGYNSIEEDRNLENRSKDFETIYFPKEYNDEQLEIIHKAKCYNKVLVQGPPGTGKSHTIANIVCDLLANGKKILITAYTKRALEVLKEKIPPEFKNLTVNLLSGDTDSLDDLASSVNGINSELSKANIKQFVSSIEDLSIALKINREKIAVLNSKLFEIKEKTSINHVINQKYNGTITEIAELLETEKNSYSWYNDYFTDINNTEIYEELSSYIDNKSYFENTDTCELDYSIPRPEELVKFEDVKFNSNLLLELQHINSINSNETFNCSDYNIIVQKLKDLNSLYDSIKILPIPFLGDIISNSIPKGINNCRHKSKLAVETLDCLVVNEIKIFDKDFEISYTSDKSLKQLKRDCNILLNYLKLGNKLSGSVFKLKRTFLPIEIKERLYFLNEVKVNGIACKNEEDFNLVLKDIDLKQAFSDLEHLWEIENNSNNYFNKLTYFTNLNNAIFKLTELYEESEKIRLELEAKTSHSILPFNSQQISKLIEITKYSEILFNLNKYKIKVAKCTNFLLNNKKHHPISLQIIEVLNESNFEKFQEIIHFLESMIKQKNDYFIFKQTEKSLSSKIPNTFDKFKNNNFKKDHIIILKNAILFRHAQKEVSKLFDVNFENKIRDDLSKQEIREKELIAQLASKKAWLHVLESLQQNRDLRQHLDAWMLAVKKIGKTGKGKRAYKFKKIAQKEMSNCKDSVPCWIMPLYKVAETITPEAGMYDYVIIDEASQLGPDAIFLLYISKNIIIVGDDKQTSPEYVGVDAQTMNPHIKRNLKDIPFSEFYGTEFSFFDHAKLFCNGTTVLREHFRCMPEIIEFSNKHFYASEGHELYPLKQYSESRLEPIKHVFCPNGYTDGKTSRIINTPEAEQIVSKVCEIISNPQYKNKTLGFITLQGHLQANLIEDLLLKAIGEQEFYNRKIICGNSASFQGDERDIIFLSLVTANNHNRAALTRPEDERRFNVACSRAKEQMWLFHSVHLEEISNPQDLRYKLLTFFLHRKENNKIQNQKISKTENTLPAPFESWFEVEVYNEIINNNYNVIPQYEVANGQYRIDLVVVLPNGSKIAIECDGDKWHSAEQFQYDTLRQKVLERVGWQFFRVRGYEFYTNRVKALESLWKLLESMSKESTELPAVHEETTSFVFDENFDNSNKGKNTKFQPEVFLNENYDDNLLEMNYYPTSNTESAKKIQKKFTKENDKHVVNKIPFDDNAKNEVLAYSIKKTDEIQNIKTVLKDSIVKLRFHKYNKVLSLQLVESRSNSINFQSDFQKISSDAPISQAIIGKSIGEKVSIVNEDNIVEILEINNKEE